MNETTKSSVDRTSGQRIGNIDLVRGVAVLGILLMNVVSFGLGTAAYFNLDADRNDTPLDWLVGGLGEIFVDQKFMAVFSMLFGAGIVLYHERAVASGRPATRLSLWRNLLLLAIGLAHGAFWDGDVLFIYAVCAPIVIWARRFSNRTLVGAAVGIFVIITIAVLAAQQRVGVDGAGLGELWGVPGDVSDAVGVSFFLDFGGRALALMLIGIVLFRSGFVSGSLPRSTYRRWAQSGLGVGIAAACIGLAITVAADFGPEVALVGGLPNTLGTIPFAVGIVAAITLWGSSTHHNLVDRLEAVGRMALTNYLMQTVIGLLAFKGLFDRSLGRAGLLGGAVVIWAAQLWWSPWWLGRFRYGPAEWLWRTATMRSLQPLRR